MNFRLKTQKNSHSHTMFHFFPLGSYFSRPGAILPISRVRHPILIQHFAGAWVSYAWVFKSKESGKKLNENEKKMTKSNWINYFKKMNTNLKVYWTKYI